jgi:cytochrome c peroxidase
MFSSIRLAAALFILCFFIQNAIAQSDSMGITSWEFYESVIPKNNPQKDSKVKLGNKLFLEKKMSSTGLVSCSTCHDPDRAFTDGKVVAEGVSNLKGKRNSPSAMNALFSDLQFWDGRAPSLEEQAKLPILNAVEMGNKTPQDVVTKIRAIEGYKPLFREAFGSDEITYERIAEAIAAFERTLVSKPAAFDKFIAGDKKAISASAQRGWELFNGQGRCTSCHSVNPTQNFFSDNKFHNIGIAAQNHNFTQLAKKALTVVDTGDKNQIDNLAIQSDFSDLGRFLVTKSSGDIGAFKTPTLRNVAATAPYMHDGSLATLWDVVDHYNKGGEANPFLDGGITRLGLTEPQINDLVEFLATLTSPEYLPLAKKEMARMRGLSHSTRQHRDTDLAMGKKGDRSDAVFPLTSTEKEPSRMGGRL